MNSSRRNLGVLGEKIASEYLQKKHYRIIKSNFKCRFGEIDIIAYKNDTYIFVEVKTRSSLSFGRPIEAINTTKKNHLLKSGQYYIQISNLKDCNFRFDAIEIIISSPISPKVNHIKNIIQ
ncbi:YraN family protein [Crassaminicella thermophila]|uniref:UPF0102 protein FQB35_07805 n=1 Tax=Crassaminicella thermophila TaxID=2599308 RepID=A0A5C0SIT5_CRATE|nr:YraN family protein [Crassaminicella thermophila]